MPKIRIEVQDQEGEPSVAWEFHGFPAMDQSMVEHVNAKMAAAQALGVPLYDAMRPAANPKTVEWQERNNPRPLCCLEFRYTLQKPGVEQS